MTEIDADFLQLKFTGGYDHNYVTDNYCKGNRRVIASAYNEASGITMDVISDCPCVQFYAGNFVIDEKGKNGHVYNKREGFCLETQVEPKRSECGDLPFSCTGSLERNTSPLLHISLACANKRTGCLWQYSHI